MLVERWAKDREARESWACALDSCHRQTAGERVVLCKKYFWVSRTTPTIHTNKNQIQAH